VLYDVILAQNYFTHPPFTYIKRSGLAMGAPTSSILSEVYLQSLEHTKLYDILIKHQITGYFRYVDDILMIYDITTTDIQKTLEHFNEAAYPMSFTVEKEKEGSINFLDISIHRHPQNVEFDIYRKPTTTDTIVPWDSNHPTAHKLAAFRYLIKRVQS
jgi:hypothetical protein